MHLSSPPSRRYRAGVALAEIALVCVLVGLLAGLAFPGLGAIRDRAAVVSARESVLALIHDIRGLAMESGGAELVFDDAAQRFDLVGPAGDTLSRLRMDEFGVEVETTGRTAEVRLRWNALGWGVVSSRTFTLRRGAHEARLVVSSRGRASRR